MKLTKEDVWGKWSEDHKLISRGMVVAQGNPSTLSKKEKEELHKQIKVTDICPYWGDKLPYKSVTVVCKEADMSEVIYWLEYVHGAGCVQKNKLLPYGEIALRSDYMCW